MACNGQTWGKKKLAEVLFVPGTQCLSMAKTLDQGCEVLADGYSDRFTKYDETHWTVNGSPVLHYVPGVG